MKRLNADGQNLPPGEHGHAEIHKWKGSLAAPRAQKVKLNTSTDAPAKSGDSDIRWLSFHGGRVSDRTY